MSLGNFGDREIMLRKMMEQQRHNRDAHIPQSSSRDSDYQNEIKIDNLIKENNVLTEKYATLLNKTALFLEKYKELETEVNDIKIKLAKREKHTKNIEDIKKILKNVFNNIIEWLKS